MAKFFIQPSYTYNKTNLNSALGEGLFQEPIHQTILVRIQSTGRTKPRAQKIEQTTEKKKKITETATANCYHCNFIVL
jgi:hypothetical protein